MNVNQATPLNAVGNSAGSMRAAQQIVSDYDIGLSGPDILSAEIGIAATIDESTRLPALVAAVDKALAAWNAFNAEPLSKPAAENLIQTMRALREQMK